MRARVALEVHSLVCRLVTLPPGWAQWTILGSVLAVVFRQMNSAASKSTLWLYIGVIVTGALVAVAAVLVAVHLVDKAARLRVVEATHTESARAHRWIIGYGTRKMCINGWICESFACGYRKFNVGSV